MDKYIITAQCLFLSNFFCTWKIPAAKFWITVYCETRRVSECTLHKSQCSAVSLAAIPKLLDILHITCKDLTVTKEQAKLSIDMKLLLLHSRILTWSPQTVSENYMRKNNKPNLSFFLKCLAFIGTEYVLSFLAKEKKKELISYCICPVLLIFSLM